MRDRLDLVVDVGAVNPDPHPEDGEVGDQRRPGESGRRARPAGETAVFRESSTPAFPGAALGHVCLLERDAEVELRGISRRYGLTGRGFHGVLRVARGIADIEGNQRITVEDLREACAYRLR